jgi:hypothetical protein
VQPIEPKEAGPPRATEDEAAQATKVTNWQREILAGLRAGLKGAPPEPAIASKDLSDVTPPSTTENDFERATNAINQLKEEADKPRETIASLHSTPPAKKAG